LLKNSITGTKIASQAPWGDVFKIIFLNTFCHLSSPLSSARMAAAHELPFSITYLLHAYQEGSR